MPCHAKSLSLSLFFFFITPSPFVGILNRVVLNQISAAGDF